MKITGGTPGAGKVLTSNAVGLASWVTPGASIPCTAAGIGIENTCYGTGVLQLNTTGQRNTANGYQALYANID